MSQPIQNYIPISTAVKAFQLPDGNWIVLNADVSAWEELSDTEFHAKYQPA